MQQTIRVKRIEKLNNPVTPVFDIGVEKNHNFFIRPKNSKSSILVSNCHQLTVPAANCLLVPMENVAPSTIYILATTNPEKLLDTVIGRCHRFQLKPITPNAMMKRLLYIAKKEGVDFEELDDGLDSIKLLASLSNGQMRDALQMLQALLFSLASGEKVDPKTLMAKYSKDISLEIERNAADLLYALLTRNLKLMLENTITCENTRQLLSKTRWLIQFVIKQLVLGTENEKGVFEVKAKQYAPVSARKFAKLVQVNGLKVKLVELIMLQSVFTEAEITMNSSIDDNIVLTSALGKIISKMREQ
jgi:DNA polymerase III gamma/tau subunit